MLLVACGGGNTPIVTPPVVTVRTFAATADTLYNIVLSGPGADTKIGSINTSEAVVDIAWDGSALYGVASSNLIRIDTNTGAATNIGNLGRSSINALTFDNKGSLYASGIDGNLYKVDKMTGSATVLGNTGYASSGDLAFSKDGTLYATVISTSASDALVKIDPATAKATIVGAIGFNNVYGLTYQNDTMYGLTDSGELLTVNTITGAGSLLRNTGLSINGVQ